MWTRCAHDARTRRSVCAKVLAVLQPFAATVPRFKATVARECSCELTLLSCLAAHASLQHTARACSAARAHVLAHAFPLVRSSYIARFLSVVAAVDSEVSHGFYITRVQYSCTAPSASRHRGPYHAPQAPNIQYRTHRPWTPGPRPCDANNLLHTISSKSSNGVHVTHRSQQQHGAPRAPQIRGNMQVRRWLRSVPLIHAT